MAWPASNPVNELKSATRSLSENSVVGPRASHFFVWQRQIEQYCELFTLFNEYSDIIERISFWNLHDGQSWLNYFPWRRVNHPLLFDRNRQPKPVFNAVYELLTSSTNTQQ